MKKHKNDRLEKTNTAPDPNSGDGAPRQDEEPAAADSSGGALQDALARLLQLDSSDSLGMEETREEFLGLATGDELDPPGRTLAAEVMMKIDEILEGGDDGNLKDAAEMIGNFLEGGSGSISAGSRKGLSAEGESTLSETSEDQLEEQIEFPAHLPDDIDRDILGDFITEALEDIDRAESALLALEESPDDQESVNTVFRAFHTIKGSSGFLELTAISELSHRAENLLSRVRDREIRYGGGYADLALRSCDNLKQLIISARQALGGEPMERPSNLDLLLRQLADPEKAGITASASAEPRQPDGPSSRQEAKASPEQSSIPSSVRVRTDRLDRLIEMVGELVIAHSILAQDRTVADEGQLELSKKVDNNGKIVRELQALSLSMRMVPLKPTFRKIARLVRDLSKKAGKDVRLVTEGEETEIDRNMVDIIGDPLVHMVRNAVDHGLERPEERKRGGKSREGLLRLSAHHSGGDVVVALQDDGRGLARDRIVEKAIAQGLIASDQGISDSDVYKLIFKPGFSTAEKVTEVSGRGVGMDVVRRNIEILRGRIDLASEPSRGTTFTMVLPLTLAITDGMLVRVGSERFIIPTVNIYISFRPEPSQLSTVTGRGEMVMLRGELMPLFRLHRVFGIEGAIEDPTQALLMLVADGDRRCALQVDELLGQQQVVAKSLGTALGDKKGISGGAILGDGRVGLILDTPELVNLARYAPTLSPAFSPESVEYAS